MKGIIIKQPWVDYILDGKKTWEIRSKAVHIRGRIAIIQSGTKTVVGYVDLVDCLQLTEEEYQRRNDMHCIDDCSQFPYKKTFAYVLDNPVRLATPIPYEHKVGCVIWVNLPDHFHHEDT